MEFNFIIFPSPKLSPSLLAEYESDLIFIPKHNKHVTKDCCSHIPEYTYIPCLFLPSLSSVLSKNFCTAGIQRHLSAGCVSGGTMTPVILNSFWNLTADFPFLACPVSLCLRSAILWASSLAFAMILRSCFCWP